MKVRSVCSMCAYGVLSLFVGVAVYCIGEFCISLLKKEGSSHVIHCSEKEVDIYYYQKLETFVDPRDSNEYTVLKFAEYRGCSMSEYDSGFLAGDTVTFYLMLENLRYKTKCSKCLDSACERGRYITFKACGFLSRRCFK